MNIKEPRKWLTEMRGNVTQQEVAEAAGIQRSFYTQIETGERNPSVKTAKQIALVLNFDWTIFFEQKCNTMTHKAKAG